MAIGVAPLPGPYFFSPARVLPLLISMTSSSLTNPSLTTASLNSDARLETRDGTKTPVPRVLFYAPSTGNAMSHALQSLIPSLANCCEVLLVTPDHFKGCAGHQPAKQFSSSGSKFARGA